MSDAQLRALERRVAEGGGAEARVLLAAELERVGRRDDAYSVLLSATESKSARELLAGYAAWNHQDGNSANTGVIDVAPVRSRPMLRLLRPPPKETHFHELLLASPLGVVVQERSIGPEAT